MLYPERFCKAKARAAFTLVELLVVVAIVAVLASLILAASGSVRAMGDRAKCLSNFRQVGATMGSYMADHDGFLPGPLWTWQSCWYRNDDYGSLANVLAPYMGVVIDGGPQKVPSLVCPAWQRDAPYQEDELFIMNSRVMIDGSEINPWGDADIVEENGEPGLDPQGRDRPRKLGGGNWDSAPAQTWAMQDWDQKFDGPRGPTYSGIPKKPVHGAIRNALFFDFHVEPIKAKAK